MNIVKQAEKLQQDLILAQKISKDLEELSDEATKIKILIEKSAYVNVTKVREMGLGNSEISKLSEYWMDGNKYARYSVREINELMETKRIKCN